MPTSSKFLRQSTGEKIVKIGQYLAKLWTKYDSLLFFGPPCMFRIMFENVDRLQQFSLLQSAVNCMPLRYTNSLLN